MFAFINEFHRFAAHVRIIDPSYLAGFGDLDLRSYPYASTKAVFQLFRHVERRLSAQSNPDNNTVVTVLSLDRKSVV